MLCFTAAQQRTPLSGQRLTTPSLFVVCLGGALGLGLAAGLVSTLGYSKLSPWLERKCGLTDTCGIHNLHALPGVLGGVAAGIAAWSQSHVLLEHGNSQLAWQLLAILVSFAIGAGGALGASRLHALARTLFLSTKVVAPEQRSWPGLASLGQPGAW